MVGEWTKGNQIAEKHCKISTLFFGYLDAEKTKLTVIREATITRSFRHQSRWVVMTNLS